MEPRRKRKRRPKLTRQQVAAFLDLYECTLLTGDYLNSKQMLEYRCDRCGHVNRACMNNLTRIGPGCKRKYFCVQCQKDRSPRGEDLFDHVRARQCRGHQILTVEKGGQDAQHNPETD